MRSLNALMVIAGLILFNSCNPKITSTISQTQPPLDYREEVEVIGIEQATPENSIELGQVRIGDTGFSTNCAFETVIQLAREEARKAGGNAIKIIEHQHPSAFGSACHRITAKILKVETKESATVPETDQQIASADYATLNVYRFGGMGAFVSYDLYLGDSLLCRVSNNFKKTILLKKDGLNTLWAKTETKEELPVDIKFGKTYYIRCSVSMGAFVGRPKLELTDPTTAKLEFESFKAKNQ